jgi:DNA-binding transcriptional ArsR family regulator/DNA-binding MarR family transcriptional regulator
MPTTSQLAQRSKALTHPVRIKIMGAYQPGRVASPSEVAEETGEPLHQVSYHVDRLVEWGWLEFVEDREVRGTLEHFYRVAGRPFYDRVTWDALSPHERAVAIRGVLSDVLADIAGAEVDGALYARLESQVYRTPVELDVRGWTELDDRLVTLIERAHEVAANSASRVATGASRYPQISSARLLLLVIPAARSVSPAEPRPGHDQPIRVEDAGSLRGAAPSSTLADRYKALSHPLRARLLSEFLGGRVASPAQLARKLKQSPQNVNYHVRQLFEWGCLELVVKRKRRGAIEHFYGFAQHPQYGTATSLALPPEERVEAARGALTAVLGEIVGSDASGLLDGQHDVHVTRTPLELDDRGWTELGPLMIDTLRGASATAASAATRAGVTEGPADILQPARLMMLLIPAPRRPKQKRRPN